MSGRVPLPAAVLGYAGLLPLAIGAVVQAGMRDALGWAGPVLAIACLGYAALILSFLGGAWWSAACHKVVGPALWRWLGAAVVPSLWAAASFIAGLPHGTGVALASGLLLTLLVDRAALRAGLVPGWWMRLRAPLSLALAAETLAVAWLA